MPFIVKGWNSFYEGWLANCFDEPFEETQDEAWKEGWNMGSETGPAKMIAMLEEIKQGKTGKTIPESHVVVTEISDEYYREILGEKSDNEEA